MFLCWIIWPFNFDYLPCHHYPALHPPNITLLVTLLSNTLLLEGRLWGPNNMGTLTAGVPRLAEHCPHKLATSCRLTATPRCCACADVRLHSTTYSVYIDGVGFVQRGTRWQSYCWFCRGMPSDVKGLTALIYFEFTLYPTLTPGTRVLEQPGRGHWSPASTTTN